MRPTARAPEKKNFFEQGKLELRPLTRDAGRPYPRAPVLLKFGGRPMCLSRPRWKNGCHPPGSGAGPGWGTAEYGMLPAANPRNAPAVRPPPASSAARFDPSA